MKPADDLARKLDQLEQRLEQNTDRFRQDIKDLAKLLEKPENETHD